MYFLRLRFDRACRGNVGVKRPRNIMRSVPIHFRWAERILFLRWLLPKTLLSVLWTISIPKKMYRDRTHNIISQALNLCRRKCIFPQSLYLCRRKYISILLLYLATNNPTLKIYYIFLLVFISAYSYWHFVFPNLTSFKFYRIHWRAQILVTGCAAE